MFVLEQKGRALYNVSTSSCIRLEFTKDNKKRYADLSKYSAVIMLYYVNEGGCLLGGYESEEEAKEIYRMFLLAVADGVNIFDLNGLLTEDGKKNEVEVNPIEIDAPEIGD